MSDTFRFAESTFGRRLVGPVSVAQLITWGSIYYCFSLFVEPMEIELGLSRTAVMGALTLALIVCAAASPFVGWLIDRGHARSVMTSGAFASGLMLWACSMVETPGALYLTWAGMGLALSATLYEPAFAVLVRTMGENTRKSIAQVTLISGLASTLFIPITHFLIDAQGWRGALVDLAALNMVVTTSIYFFVLRDERKHLGARERDTNAGKIAMTAFKQAAFWCLSISVGLSYFVGAGLMFHIIPLLSEKGFTTEQAVFAAALYGPAMLGARAMLSVVVDKLSIAVIGCLATLPIITGLIYLALGPSHITTIILFVFLLGLGNGILTLAKPMAVAQVYDKAAFGAINGAMTTPMFVFRAFAPAGLAALWTVSNSYDQVAWILAAALTLALILFVIGVRAHNPP